ncbi:MAG: hypothetical protein KF886_13240 [Candidatus Hydrogenedentes bacterium]|nr:hypothetical protein [Candidatus Hydrogenedentota bacterium]
MNLRPLGSTTGMGRPWSQRLGTRQYPTLTLLQSEIFDILSSAVQTPTPPARNRPGRGKPMFKFFQKRHENIAKAPLSFAFGCFGAGMVFATLLMREFGLSELAIDNIAYLIGFASVIYFHTNSQEEKPAPRQQGE